LGLGLGLGVNQYLVDVSDKDLKLGDLWLVTRDRSIFRDLGGLRGLLFLVSFLLLWRG